MIIRFLLKIWPALLPILVYCLWIVLQKTTQKIITKNSSKKSGKIINATYHEVKNEIEPNKIGAKVGNFSLQNQHFIIVLYLSFFVAIICFLFFAIRIPNVEEDQYIPAHVENGKIIPGKIIDRKRE